MRQSIKLLALLLLASFALAGPTAAAENKRLAQAIEAYWNAEFDDARAALEELDAKQLAADDVLQWHKFRAMCAMAQGATEQARQAFAALLAIQPRFKMDPLEVAPPVLSLFEEAQFNALKAAFDNGKSAYARRDYGAAAAYFDTVLQIDPLNAHGRAFQHLALENAGNAE